MGILTSLLVAYRSVNAVWTMNLFLAASLSDIWDTSNYTLHLKLYPGTMIPVVGLTTNILGAVLFTLNATL